MADTISTLFELRLAQPGEPLRLHLGCGEVYLDGYINIDYPSSEHTLQMHQVADVFTDITTLSFAPNSVDEIRLHHVFEHFDRATALALLCNWHYWLKVGGVLRLETPDFEASVNIFKSPQFNYQNKQVVLRHLFGSHEAHWALHWDGWYKEKFDRVLTMLGFEDLSFEFSQWIVTRNITVEARKAQSIPFSDLRIRAIRVLRDSLLDDSDTEQRLWHIWQNKLTSNLSLSDTQRLALVSIYADTVDLDLLGFDNVAPERDDESPLLRALLRDGDVVAEITDGDSTFAKYSLKHLHIESSSVVRLQTLDNFCTERSFQRVDFLKIDAEGAELEILQGASHLLSEGSLRYIQFEYGGTYHDSGATLQQIAELLSQFNYALFRILPHGLAHISQWRDSLENYRYSNYLAVCPADKGPWASIQLQAKPTHEKTVPPRVSIFMAVYNSEKYLAEAINSILAQTFRNFELIIADDGSSDQSLVIAQSYAQRDARVRVVALPHKGEVATRNAAVQHTDSQTAFLINHDSDDISLPDKLEKLVNYLDTHPLVGIVGSFAEYFGDQGHYLGEAPIEWESPKIRSTFMQVNSMINSAALIRREVFVKLGPYRESFRSVDDYDFFARALTAGVQLANIPEVLHKIRLHPASVSATRALRQEFLSTRIRASYILANEKTKKRGLHLLLPYLKYFVRWNLARLHYWQVLILHRPT